MQVRGRPQLRSSGRRRPSAHLAAACLLLVAARLTAAAERPIAVARLDPRQTLTPAAPYPIAGLDCASGSCGELGWNAARPIDWQTYAQGEYLGHERPQHVPDYRLRVGDELDLVFRFSRTELPRAYTLNVGDRIRVESLSDAALDRELVVQPDGTVTLPLVGQVYAARATVAQLRDELERRFQQFYKQPAINVTPLKVNTRLEDMRSTVDLRYGYGGQSRRAKVAPEGTIQLPLVGNVAVQGLSLDEVQSELEQRYAAGAAPLDVTPVLLARAPRYIYVLGEVASPGRYELTGPTTAMQALSKAGGWNHGGNVWNTIIFRRGDDWRLMATQLELRGPLYGTRPCPADEIWLNDADILLVPKTRILVAQNVIDLVFTQGLYKIAPFALRTSYNEFRVREVGRSPFNPVLPVITPPVSPVHAPVVPAPSAGSP